MADNTNYTADLRGDFIDILVTHSIVRVDVMQSDLSQHQTKVRM